MREPADETHVFRRGIVSKKYLLTTKDNFKKPSILSLLFSNIVERYLKTVFKKKNYFPHPSTSLMQLVALHLSLPNVPRNSLENTLLPGPLLHTSLWFLLSYPPSLSLSSTS